jgi:hypothetical protein
MPGKPEMPVAGGSGMSNGSDFKGQQKGRCTHCHHKIARKKIQKLVL